jgi:diguanylate cyclase (GGDEF)-like protein
MWDPSTIAIDKTELTFFQNLEAPERLHCSLVVYSGGDTGRQITLEEGTHTIGRSAAARLAIDGPGMSRLHAEVTVQGGSVLLRDLGSANGSFVQDQRLTGPRLLNDGDLLRLGSVLLKFYEHRSVDAALHDRVYRLAMIDAGTGLYNRRYLNDALRRELRLARQHARPLTVISLDLDRFKHVNDHHGHAAGDLVLRDCAALLAPLVGGAGILGRIGGEEFLVLLPDTPLAAARALAERLRAAVAGHAFLLPVGESEGRRRLVHRQTVSLGVAEWGPAMLEACDLLDAADRRLYQAKHEGRDRVSG